MRRRKTETRSRCPWAESHPLLRVYHDREWGRPVHDDRRLFEMLVLEGAQAGLTWLTILKKRDEYRRAFGGFSPERIARYGPADVRRLMADPGIVRNRLKITGAIRSAQAFLAAQKEFGSFDRYIWSFVDGHPIVTARTSLRDIPAQTSESKAMSKELRKRGFMFVGPTICYAFMQAVGMVSDHLTTCYRCPPNRKSRRSR